MIRAADETYVIADSSKFGSGNLFTVCTMDDVSRIITDDGVSKEKVALARKLNIEMDLV